MEEVTGARRDAARARATGIWPGVAAYERRSGRVIPYFRLPLRRPLPSCRVLLAVASGGRLQRRLEKYVFNPPNKLLLRLGVAPKAFALLETKGRRTGAARVTPVGNGLDGSVFWIVAEHGIRCDYLKNLLADPNVRVKVGRRWRNGTAAVVDDDDGFARRRGLDRKNGLIGRADGVIFRASASEPVTIRVDLK